MIFYQGRNGCTNYGLSKTHTRFGETGKQLKEGGDAVNVFTVDSMDLSCIVHDGLVEKSRRT